MKNNGKFVELSFEEEQQLDGGGKWPWEVLYDACKDAGALFYRKVYRPVKHWLF